jgi:dihydropteroate synthase-like protein
LSNKIGKVLLITGVLAKDIVERYAKESTVETETLALKTQVAAFLTPETIIKNLECIDLNGFSTILVPGLVRGDTALVTKATGIETFKGPQYAADLPTVLDFLGRVQLSTVVPACELMHEKLVEKALQEIQNTEKNRLTLLKKPSSMLIGDLAVGKEFPMRVLAEIVDAPLMNNQTIQCLAKKFVAAGASLIDVGMVAGEIRPKDAKRIVQAVKQVVDVPVSIDTLDPTEIKVAVLAGADLVLSVDAGNIEEIASCVKNVAVVVIPTNQKQGYFPKKTDERVRFLEETIAKAKNLGVIHILADLILEPTNILESFIAFRQFAERNPNVPLFVGISNVTELMDADSVGINALLATLSSEVNASVLLATEKSDKAKGTVAEELAAAKMMFLARKRGTVPKDLGVNLLILKDKRNHEEVYNKLIEQKAPVTIAEKAESAKLDAFGSFTIQLDRIDNTIAVLHYASGKTEAPDQIIKGKTADAIYMKIIQSHLTSRIDHMAYLGAELAKAEVALRIGKEYIQDAQFFTR